MEKKTISKASLKLDDAEISLDVITGSEGEQAIDISRIRKETGIITLDPGFANTGACASDITFVDGEQGILRFRGYDLEDLADNCTFLEVAYLLVHGKLPNSKESAVFSELMNQHSLIHEDMRSFFHGYPDHSHPMAILSAMVVSLSSFYPELDKPRDEAIDITVTRLLAKIRTIAAFSYKKFIGEPFVYPRHDYSYCCNFLHMMFDSPINPVDIGPRMIAALNKLLILHADHEQNCSTSVVRFIGSARANLYAAISAGICALWGPLHGGANQKVIEMLEDIRDFGGSVDTVIKRAKDKSDPYRLMGFGHRVYKSYDPRARIAKQASHEIMDFMNKRDPLLDIALELEEKAMADPYFQERGLYPNVDFYTGLSYRAMGFPTNMFTVLFAMGRLPGWIAHWLELDACRQPINRPRQIYTGPVRREFVPMAERD
jgi:citrate synthase